MWRVSINNMRCNIFVATIFIDYDKKLNFICFIMSYNNIQLQMDDLFSDNISLETYVELMADNKTNNIGAFYSNY